MPSIVFAVFGNNCALLFSASSGLSVSVYSLIFLMVSAFRQDGQRQSASGFNGKIDGKLSHQQLPSISVLVQEKSALQAGHFFCFIKGNTLSLFLFPCFKIAYLFI